MRTANERLRPGDLVEVRSPHEILQTLDSDGTLHRLPFMPEMIPFCGQRIRVAQTVLKTCASGLPEGSTMRGFPDGSVVTLQGVRCTGADHDGCQKYCNIFWRQEWLKPVDSQAPAASAAQSGAEELRARLKTKSGPDRYFCQASEILNVTRPLSKVERFSRSLDDLRAGNASFLEMARRVSIWVFWKLRRMALGPYGKGTCQTTPAVTLDLQSGEHVMVKSMSSITATLNPGSYNRGLWFSPDMRLECGHEKTVYRHLERIIVDGTGEMRKMKNTVYLKDSFCSCPHVAFGGCPRREFVYWREIWLERSNSGK